MQKKKGVFYDANIFKKNNKKPENKFPECQFNRVNSYLWDIGFTDTNGDLCKEKCAFVDT